ATRHPAHARRPPVRTPRRHGPVPSTDRVDRGHPTREPRGKKAPAMPHRRIDLGSPDRWIESAGAVAVRFVIAVALALSFLAWPTDARADEIDAFLFARDAYVNNEFEL